VVRATCKFKAARRKTARPASIHAPHPKKNIRRKREMNGGAGDMRCVEGEGGRRNREMDRACVKTQDTNYLRNQGDIKPLQY